MFIKDKTIKKMQNKFLLRTNQTNVAAYFYLHFIGVHIICIYSFLYIFVGCFINSILVIKKATMNFKCLSLLKQHFLAACDKDRKNL